MTADPRASTADAVLVIGDRAMHPERFRPSFIQDWDLGQAWLEETQLPFVFAMWVARHSEFATDWLRQCFEDSRDQGLSHVSDIVRVYARDYELSESQCVDYLTQYLRFFMTDEEQRGLDEFRRRCIALELVDSPG